ncbi:MAG TPA: ABC transporter ATP-binding protein [Trueperaceae bacterium]|nr:ABC transporter ATP-binding protein [Trueperaceae bacterium]
MSVLLEMKGLTAGYDGSDVLKALDLNVERGSITCIVGPNGAGKSTVLKVVSGLLKPRRGSMHYRGTAVSGFNPRKALALGIVQVPQNHSLFPEMSVRENVRLGAYTVRDPGLVETRMREVADMFPIVEERAGEKAGNLSGGQQRLVEFARSLMLDPELILLDEPSMGLDPRTLKSVFETVARMHEGGRTILLVEQNVRAGLGIATHGIVLESGRVRLEGSHDEVLGNPQIGRLYLGVQVAGG